MTTNQFKELFDGGLGRYTGGLATLRVRAGAAPVFHRARPLPYALRERVDAELDAMLRAGVIEPVDCSDWASPLVPINKPDGTLRICADYKSTLNPSLLVDRYPLPKIEDVLVNLNGNLYFSKIDLSQAYNQIELDDSKKYTVINTHRGLFRYNRLVYGLASSVGIFQRIMTNLLCDIPNVQVFLDDIIVGGRSRAAHLLALESIFQRLKSYGLKLKKSKCVFFAKEVTYLGYVVSKEGTRPDASKIEGIVKMEQPQNVPELRSFLGTVNFFGRFVKNLSPMLSPLYTLLRKGVEWNWDSECELAFNSVKQQLSGASVLAHYDPDKPLIATCDASARGLGAVLTQPGPRGERPVAFASRSLNNAERNYSQIHREALAIIFCIKKFHQDGWPDQCDIDGLKPYFNRKTELYEELGCLMWGYRVVIPEACRDKVLEIIHEPHMGIVKSKALARSYVWWAGIDEAVEGACRACSACAATAAAPPQHAPRPWPWPRRPWSRIHLDFMGPILGKTYLVVIDAMSKWIEVFQVPSTSASSTIDRSRKSLAFPIENKTESSDANTTISSPTKSNTQSKQSVESNIAPAHTQPESPALARSVEEGEAGAKSGDDDCFATPEKVFDSPNVQPVVPAEPPQSRPIRKCRLDKVPRYKF
ncbi:uncharacterized protein K02A2.6-like [Ostrinia nubilalis]|uniref:uncharacterized protein K02A2.6-like n=1 Tax=Ostrinia nubilalis TaxID=29057 RepID=UPI0030823BF7